MTHRTLWGTERGMVATISFSDDARWVATSDWDCVVKIWDTRDLKCLAEIGPSENSEVLRIGVSNLTFLSNGQHLAMSYCEQYPTHYDRQCVVYD